MIMLSRDADYFYELQTQTGWGRTISGFAKWCAPKPGWMTLDVGCGPGLLPAVLAKYGCCAVGVDLDHKMFHPSPLHSIIAVADVNLLPFTSNNFDLITASNLLFLLPQPIQVLLEMKRVLKKGGKVALLNPSEHLNVNAAVAFTKERGLEGMASDTLLNWAKRAEENQRWTDDETKSLFVNAGMNYENSVLKVGPGFARFSWGTN
jgi:ubiquinone/menaquinone biosynthesis C-methylase UbiE